MAKNITLLGASYPDVPSVVLPQTGGGTAEFFDLEEVFPVGGYWATGNSTANPATVLGFGTWSKVSPGALTWGQLADTTWNPTGTVAGIYVWQRTA